MKTTKTKEVITKIEKVADSFTCDGCNKIIPAQKEYNEYPEGWCCIEAETYYGWEPSATEKDTHVCSPACLYKVLEDIDYYEEYELHFDNDFVKALLNYNNLHK